MIALTLPQSQRLSDQDFMELTQSNRDLRLEMSATGELVIMAPTGGETGARNTELIGQLWTWNRQTGLGQAFDSSTGFTLPNGPRRSPDLSWLTLDRWQSLTPDQRRKFIPLCPDFAVELMSDSDDFAMRQAKMMKYLENGLRLGWLIMLQTKQVEIYRPGQVVEILDNPKILSGEAV